jgi:hypothetical protein
MIWCVRKGILWHISFSQTCNFKLRLYVECDCLRVIGASRVRSRVQHPIYFTGGWWHQMLQFPSPKRFSNSLTKSTKISHLRSKVLSPCKEGAMCVLGDNQGLSLINRQLICLKVEWLANFISLTLQRTTIYKLKLFSWSPRKYFSWSILACDLLHK